MQFSTQGKLYPISLIAAMLLLAASLAWIGTQVHAYSVLQMDLDEALHATRGLDIASALRRGSLPDLWYETVKPHWYPPGHGYLMGIWFLLASPSITTARLYAGVCYVLLGVLLWASARQVFPKIHPVFLLTPTLFLLSDNQHLILASMSMLDLPANLLAFASLYFTTMSLARPGARYPLLASLFALLTFFSRYSQGSVIFITIGVTYILSYKQLKGRIQKIAASWAPALVTLFIWLIVLGEWQWVVAYANADPGQGQAWSLTSLAFYLRQLAGESSGWLPVLSIILWFLSKIRQRDFSLLLLPYGIFFTATLFVLSYRSNHLARFGSTLFLPLWVISAGAIAGLLNQVRWRGVRFAGVAIWLLLLVFLGLKNQRSLPAALPIAYENTNPGVNDAYRFIGRTIGASRQERLNLVMYGETDSWNSYALHFTLQSNCMRTNPNCLVHVTGERELNKGWPPQNTTEEVRDARARAALSAADYVLVFAKTPVLPEGWAEVARQEFTFERVKIDPKLYQVVVLKRANSVP